MINNRHGTVLDLIFIKDACVSACRDLAPNCRVFTNLLCAVYAPQDQQQGAVKLKTTARLKTENEPSQFMPFALQAVGRAPSRT